MSKRWMNEQQILDALWGATLMGGGGGGPLQPAVDLLEKFKEKFPDREVSLELYEPGDMSPGAYAGVTASMGAPTAIKDKDFFAITANTFAAMQDMAAGLNPPKEVAYSYGVELGGFNTFVPILSSLLNGIPFIDADGAGRAVPALNTLLLHINGFDTTPLVMADEKNNRLTIGTADPRDAEMAEEICRYACVAFGMQAGVAGWLAGRDEILKKLPCGTVTLCEKIGHVLRSCGASGQNAFAQLAEQGVECKFLSEGVVTKTENLCEKGFDYGKIYISCDNGQWIICYQNENLVVYHNDVPFMTLPDIICCYETDTCFPLTNADIREGMKITIGAIPADEGWWRNPKMFQVWEPFLARVGYNGSCIRYGKNSL